ARDEGCVRPGCGNRAHDCELDHTEPYDLDHPGRGGRTGGGNLGPPCLWDRPRKAHGDVELRQIERGVCEWTSAARPRHRRGGETAPTVLAGCEPEPICASPDSS